MRPDEHVADSAVLEAAKAISEQVQRDHEALEPLCWKDGKFGRYASPAGVMVDGALMLLLREAIAAAEKGAV